MKDLASLGFLLAALLACGQSATRDQLVVRASSDLGCQNQRIESHSLDSRTVIAVGCGREATYVEDCEECTNGFTKMNESCNCTWIMSGSVRNRAGSMPSAASVPPPSPAASPAAAR